LTTYEEFRQKQLAKQAEDSELKIIFTNLWNKGETYKQISDKMGITFSKTISLRQHLKLPSRMTTRYTIEGKIEQPLTDDDFKEGMEHGKFLKQKHRAFCVLLYYSAVRKKEALRAFKEQFVVSPKEIIFNVGKRLKHGKETPGLNLPLDALYMNELLEALRDTKHRERVFPYCDKTGYNIVRRAFKYPHLFRLSRITNFFLEGYTIPEVKSWTGLTLKALNYYVGLVSVKRMGESLGRKNKR